MFTLIANVKVRKPDRNGNTYHDVELINANNKTIYNEVLGSVQGVYGYGEHYKNTASELITKVLPKLVKKAEKKGIEFKLDHFRNLEALLEAKILKVIWVVN